MELTPQEPEKAIDDWNRPPDRAIFPLSKGVPFFRAHCYVYCIIKKKGRFEACLKKIRKQN
jgi:hypothetical protein